MTALTDEQLDQIYDKAWEANEPECGCHGAGLRAVAEAAVQAERVTAAHWKQMAESLQAALETRQRRDAVQAEREGIPCCETVNSVLCDLDLIAQGRDFSGYVLTAADMRGTARGAAERLRTVTHPPQASATVPEGYAIGRDGSAVYIIWNDSKRREHFTRYSDPITFGFLLAMLAASQPDAGKAQESAS